MNKGLSRSQCHPQTCSSLQSQHCQVLEDLQMKETQLSNILMENQELQLKLEALREAGAETLKNAATRLLHQHQQQAQEQKEMYGELKKVLQTHIMELDGKICARLKHLNSLERKLQDKQQKVYEIEKLTERMKEEQTALITKRNVIEHKIRCKLSNVHKPGPEAESLRSHKIEICTLGEKIYHLDDMILAQSNKIHFYLQQIKLLNVDLTAQENAVESLTEKLHAVQAKNEELKYMVEFWHSQAPKNSAGTTATWDYGSLQEVYL
ncbi:coiled-coil domain-containing protein 68 [Arapaima gigas]